MAKISSARETDSKIIEFSYIKENLDWARNWYKSVKMPKNVKIKTSSSGGPINGQIKNGLLELSYIVPFGYPVPSFSRSVETSHIPEEFRGRLIRAYEEMVGHCEVCEKKIKKIDDSGGITPPKPFNRFKTGVTGLANMSNRLKTDRLS